MIGCHIGRNFQVTVAGEANKHKHAFKKDFTVLCERLLT